MYNKFKVKHKNVAVEEELLLTVEDIYPQFSNLRELKILCIANQSVFTVAYSDDLKLG